jgi:uncharacterized flavoprotein (TIGR03862 family)
MTHLPASDSRRPSVLIVGAGPAGLMAAERLADAGASVTVYDRMPSPGRKFLMAGRGGLNVTHSEPLDRLTGRYGAAAAWLRPVIEAFPPDALRNWCEGLGQKTFVGSSGRIFPEGMKASPLLRAWLRRLDGLGVTFRMRHEWRGWDAQGRSLFINSDGKEAPVAADAVLLALGGASWPRLGADGGWVHILRRDAIAVASLRPANCGFAARWSEIFADRCAGQPLKPVGLSFGGISLQGEAMITRTGLEGGGIYALSAALRDAIERDGKATLIVDLKPRLNRDQLAQKLGAPRGSQSLSTFLRKAAGLSPAMIGLLREAGCAVGRDLPTDMDALAALIKDVPVTLTGVASIDRAISTAGGVVHDEIDATYMLKKRPGCFIAGEMLDWEAPTGGYLLQGCFATGVAAAKGIRDYLVF